MTKKILVVDDEPSLQEMLKDILQMAGYDVITAGNGKEGLAKLSEESPDLVILDCSMPVLDGYETLAQMRSDPTLVNKPVIMLSVRSGEYDEIRGLKLGVNDYITKPFKSSLLLARVAAILERSTQSISANPLTLLAGNQAIKAEAEKRIADGAPFAVIYADLNNFKSFNDRYGFQRGDEIIKHTADIIIKAVKEHSLQGYFIGHIGGDDFIIISSIEEYEAIARDVIKRFDESVVSFYDPDDRARGYIVSTDRNNEVRKFPFMTISLAVVATDRTKITHYGQLSEITAQLKKLAKRSDRSTFVVDRRKEYGTGEPS